MTGEAENVPEKRHSPFARALARTVGLQKATDVLGQAKLAEGLGVAPRTLRSYLSVERGLPNAALTGAAAMLEQHAAEATALAGKLRDLAAS